jgi:hypothetical protein
MSDFLKAVEDGIRGSNTGLKSGLPGFDAFTDNIQEECYISVGAQKKTGKTAFVDFRYLLMPYLLNPGKDIHWIYYSYEISRIRKIAKFVAFLIHYKYGILITPNVILGKGDRKLSTSEKKLVEEIYHGEIEDLFGQYNSNGTLLKRGKIDFFEKKTNPTGIKNYLDKYFLSAGEFKEEVVEREISGEKVSRVEKSAYVKNNPNSHTIIILDHMGLLARERGFSKKDNMDKMSEYFVMVRNSYKPTIVVVNQFNRDLGKIDRLKFSGEDLQPSAEDWKETGTIAEDVNMLIALFNPSLYPHIHKHLEYNIDRLGKRYISLHLLESRDTEGFVDMGLYFAGECGYFKELPAPDKVTEEIYKKIETNTVK